MYENHKKQSIKYIHACPLNNSDHRHDNRNVIIYNNISDNRHIQQFQVQNITKVLDWSFSVSLNCLQFDHLHGLYVLLSSCIIQFRKTASVFSFQTSNCKQNQHTHHSCGLDRLMLMLLWVSYVIQRKPRTLILHNVC